ncbi:MAG TPA: MFS transporter [Candidatus Krumholzibacteria bacterium]|nr:MFS transporter [Candidatus Krumholzibacteria bacterium]HPD72565.1 MFS transporter [Candidatus Krumholzibacteria bacterium]HRY40503.1 MFS transporter [Candidatus Krumholzibacteria bacterium]
MHAVADRPVNRGILLAVILISSFFNPFMGSAVNIALPSIGKDLAMTAVAMSWIPMGFLLLAAVMLVPFGKLADIVGRRKMLLWGNVGFAGATLLCGFATSSALLIGARCLQGAGSAMILSSGMAIVISAFPAEKRGAIIGLNTTAVYVGLSAAPLLGGLLTQSLGWQSLFFINAAVGLLVVAGIAWGVRAEWAEARDDRFDVTGSLVYIASMSMLMYGFSQLPGRLAVVLTLAGSAGLVYFVALELRSAVPVLDMKLFRDNRIFAYSNLAALINYAATFGITFLLSLYLQSVKGLSPRDAGMIMLTQPATMAVVAAISGRLSDRIEPRILSSLGMAVIVAGLVLLAFLSTTTREPYVVVTLLILGFGFGLFSSPNTNAVMSSVEQRFLGTASATLGTMRLTGQMFSMAIAAMVIHIFIGDAAIAAANIASFMHSVRVTFTVFAALCLLGVFASLARGGRSAA